MAAMFDRTDVASPGHYQASQTALLLLDFHSMFVQRVGGPNAETALKTAASLRKWAKKNGVQVIHGLIDVDAKVVSTSKQHARMESVGGMMKASGGDKEPADILETGDDADLHFTRPPGYISALSSPGIMQELHAKNVKSLVLCGLSTSGCVLRTAADACEKELVVTVISDACADPDEEVHRVVVGKVLQMTAFVSTADEFMAGFRQE